MYLKAVSSIAGEYTTPEIFTYKASGVNLQDIALKGIWVEQKNTLGDVSTNMNLEENSYGLIANTKAEYIKLDENFVNSINKDNETGIKNIESNKIILKVIDEKLTEPIMAKLSAKGKKVTIKIIKTDNGIKEVRAVNGKTAEKISETEFLYTVEKGGLNKFIVIDNIGNQRLYEITVISPEIYVLTNEEDFVEFNEEKWYPSGTKVRIKYADNMSGKIGYYQEINGTRQNPVTWTSTSATIYRDFTLTETMKYKAKIENSSGEILGEDEATIHIMPTDTSIPSSYIGNIGGIYPVKVTGYVPTKTSFYGTETYLYTTKIQTSAVHMGLLKSGENKVLYIKIVPSPQGGYTGSTRNGVTTIRNEYNYNGYIFVTEAGDEIKIPTISSVTPKQEENRITVTVDAKSYNTDKTIEKYYYSIDSTKPSSYIESDSNEYVFNDVKEYANHTIRVYVKDSYGIISNINEITTRTGNALPTPTIEVVDEDAIETIEYDGKIWYPYGTQIRINYAEDMTNLTGYYKTINETTGAQSEWKDRNYATYQTSIYETTTYIAKLKDSTGEETEEVRFTIYIMPYTKGSIQSNYTNNLGYIYPVRVKGTKSGSVYGTDTYVYQSNIQYSAIHMGLLTVNETKDLFIKIVLSPAGGYRASIKNGITSSQDNTNNNGYIFVTKDGEEIRSPIIESMVLTNGENTITATVSATTNIGTVDKYYYSIDDGTFIESNSNVYEFTDIEAYKSHTIKVYVKNIYGAISDVITLTGKTRNTIPTPTIEIVNKDAIKTIEYDGKVWYPYNTPIKITYAEDMTNLTGQYKYINATTGVESEWYNASSSTYEPYLSESITYVAKIKDSTGAESEEVSIHLNIMAFESSLQSNYCTYGLNQIYPVRVNSSTSDSTVYGTNTYSSTSRIKTAAVHMGLLEENETKDLFIKIVECPEGQYKSSIKNGIISNEFNSIEIGYIFVTKDGKEIKSPTLNNLTTIGGENSITATLEVNCTNSEPQEYYYAIVDETTYKNNISRDKDYYKKNPTYLTFNKSEEKSYQFTVEPYKNYRIIAYAKDSDGAVSEFYDVVGVAGNEVPKPTIEIVDKDTLETVEYDGKTWYPYGTQIKITYAEELTNLTPYYNWHVTRTNFSSWNKDSNISRTTTLSEPMKIYAKNVALTGEEAEEELTVYIMPGNVLESAFTNYYLGQTFPVIATGNTNGTIYGTETYKYNSYIAKAAMHMGILNEGQKDTLYVKIVEAPETYYKTFIRNNINSTESLSSDNGYIFVTKDGEEIKPKGEIVEPPTASATGDITISVPEDTKYIEYKGEKWYPPDTKVTINYTGTGTRYNWYAYRNEVSNNYSSWNNNGTSNTWTATASKTTTYFARIIDASHNNIVAEKSMKINIMPENGKINGDFDYVYAIGEIYPVEVTYSTSGNCYGTNTYMYQSNINKAATHMGLVKEGETKVVCIKIVSYPTTGYRAASKNGVTTQSYNYSANGFVFLDENEKEIIDNNYVLGEVGATLSGYNVINNNTNTSDGNAYTFINDGTSIIPTNSKVITGRNEWITASSYIEIDLTGKDDELYTVTLNAEISADNRNTGYAMITENVQAPQRSSEYISISGQKTAQDYTTILVGGKKYYLHFGYFKHTSYNTYEDLIRFNSLKVEKLPNSQYPTITIDSSVTPVEYNGELLYPYNTQVTINYNENWNNRYYKYEYEDGTTSAVYTSSSNSYTIKCTRPMTIKAGYTNDAVGSSLKINIIPDSYNLTEPFYNNIGAIYPIEIMGTTYGTIYGTAKYYYGSTISTAAVHMGLVKPGETKTVFIKIIDFPQGGYKGSRMNSITSKDYNSNSKGYIFVTEAGEEILEPIITPNAILSGYDVYPNGSYYFEQLGDSISCSSAYQSRDSGSYIELNLSKYSKEDMFKVKLNMEISGYYDGCASITKTKDTKAYTDGTGRFIYVGGTQEAKNYGTIIPGGEKYYLHLASYRYNSNTNGENQVKFNSLEVTQIPKDKEPEITIDSSIDPVIYKGELWYPNGTKITIRYIEDDCNYKNINLDNKSYFWSKYRYEITNNEYSYKTNNENITETLDQTTTFWAKYGENSPEKMLKVNIMPNDANMGDMYPNTESNVGNIYPVVVTGANSQNIYGNNIYFGHYYYNYNPGSWSWTDNYYTDINTAAVHMGLVEIGETKTVYIKVVKIPEGGYIGAIKNTITSKDLTNRNENGFVFVTEDGTEIYEPIINSATAVMGSESTIVATVNAIGNDGAKIQKYYYSIDNGEYIETENNTYTFTDIDVHKTHTVKIYVRDEFGAVSQTKEIVTSVVTNNVIPTITIDENAIPIEYNGELWYPNGTKLTINYAEDMTNLTGYYAYIDEGTGNQSSWKSNSSNKTYTTTLNHSITYMAKIVDKTGNETDVAKRTIRIMPDGENGASYYEQYLGNIYPVRVIGTSSGNAYGEDTYAYSSKVSTSATHMGLVDIDETKVVLIKIVPAPVGGYKGTLRNGVQTSNYSYTYNGYVFVDEAGNEITRPKINSVVTTSGDNEITVTVNTDDTMGKYYYSIDNEEYVETTSNVHTFDGNNIEGNRTIKVYVKDSDGNNSSIKEFYGYINTVEPTFAFDKEPIVYNEEKWYPYGTHLQINFSQSDNGYYRSANVYSTNSVSSWTTTRTWPYTVTLNQSVIYEAYHYNGISGESEHVREKINIMANPSSLQSNYYNYGSGNIYPVQVTGTKSGNIYGTGTYMYSSNINKAATHAGLVNTGETKIVYIKIVPCPEGGYVGSTQNGITSNEYSSANVGYTFVQ